MRNRSSLLALAPLLALTAIACSQPSDGGDGSGADEAAVTELKAYWADAKRLDLGDLTRTTVGFATQSLNDQLAAPGFAATFEPPAVFAATADPNRIIPDVSEIKALDTIVSGLAARFGEKELGTEVNAVRLRHLQGGDDQYFVESAFSTQAGLSHGWSFAANGLADSSVTVGFEASAALSSRVIVAAKDENLSTLVKTPLVAAATMRGFIYPRSVADVRSMKPGEMFALRGVGKLGANFGLGAPILVAEPTAGAAYRLVVSAGISGVVGGQLDVQLVRMEGDEVVVDVGVENGKGVSFNAAIKDGWGVKGICEDGIRCLRPVNLAGAGEVDLSKLVAKAVETRLNSYLTSKIEGQAASASSRVSLSRFRFHLDAGNADEVEKALQQTLKFDVRLAQALNNRDLDQKTHAVDAEFDAVRAATTATRSFGFELLGMNMYNRAVVEQQGSFVVQTPEGARSVLFDSVNNHSGWFQTDHGFTRTGVAAQTLDARDPENFKSEANLFLQTAVGDTHMDNDMIIDNVDAMLLGLVGRDAIDALDAPGNAMQRMVWEKCPVVQDRQGNTKTWDEQCNVTLLDSQPMKDLKAQGLAAIEPFASRLPDDFAKIVRDAANVRMTLQSVGIHNLDAINGPNVSFTMDVRFDDKALGLLTAHPKADYAAALREYVTAIYADRNKVGAGTTKDAVRAQVDDKWGSAIAKMAGVFESRSKAYRLIMDAERLVPSTLAGKSFVSYPMGIRFAVDRDSAKTYASATIDSTAHDRSNAASRLFDDLMGEATHVEAALYDEHTAAFPLLALVPTKNLQLGMDIRADVQSSFWVKRERYLKAGFTSAQAAGKGAEVSTIRAGMFDLDAILAGN